MTRGTLVAANWKMHGRIKESGKLLTDLRDNLADVDSTVVVCPPALFIPLAHDTLEGSSIRIGAQNLYTEKEGAFTGEISAPMLTEFGCRYVLVGHSERRELFGENNALVAAKFVAARKYGLIPVLCIGETLEKREAKQTAQVVLNQLDAVLNLAGIEAFENAVVAYEPVWAIGTGIPAFPEQAQEVHALVREHVAGQSADIAASLKILYGGSVKAANAAELFGQPDIDGALVGGASLVADEFIRICQAADQSQQS